MIAGYLVVTIAPLAATVSRVEGAALAIALHAAAALAIFLWSARPPRSRALAVARDLYPLAAIVLLYSEFRTLAHAVSPGFHDSGVAAVEARLFGSQPSQTLRDAAPWPWLREYLHLAYVSYYGVPVAPSLALVARGRSDALAELLTATLAAFLACCLVYIVYPVAGPYHHFGHPDAAALPGFFTPLAHRVVQAGSSVGTAFPSSHTAVAVAVWVSTWRLARPAFWGLALVVPGLAAGTVYGGFHYAIDTVAGAAIGAAAALAAPRLHHARGAAATPPRARARAAR
jgi:membrane-associated phospholipid phosphatase